MNTEQTLYQNFNSYKLIGRVVNLGIARTTIQDLVKNIKNKKIITITNRLKAEIKYQEKMKNQN